MENNSLTGLYSRLFPVSATPPNPWFLSFPRFCEVVLGGLVAEQVLLHAGSMGELGMHYHYRHKAHKATIIKVQERYHTGLSSD